ncbi:MAG: MBL fold metallo-hydrolase [Patescibacteria group bacterium]|nr:MBL fold metallo-hydrolase [Patescibacteria group bacterium]MDD5164803.1 MBL fold metallo-hydrolase [Patescibacteria group bacterium]MDD5534434.1 MBL fold metallo-hydrolase [Patescibacteria group bacterium]
MLKKLSPKILKIIIFSVTGLLLINLVILGYWLILTQNNYNSLRVVFFDVGQGDSALIQTPEGKNILIDGGPDKNVIYKLDKYIPITRRKIDLMILTHPDPDHLIGLVEVLRRWPVDQIVTNNTEETDSLYFEWKKLIQEKNITPVIISEQRKIWLNDKIYLDFLWPIQELAGQSNKDDNNPNSLVFKLVDNQNKILFTGDATSEIEKILLDNNYDLQSQVLKVGHHGSKYSSDLNFLEKISPIYGVISVGQNNKFGHPSLRALTSLEEVGAEILRTDQNGDIVFIDKNGKLILKIEK